MRSAFTASWAISTQKPTSQRPTLSKRPNLQPYVGNDLPVIAWLWIRTVNAQIPLVVNGHLLRSFSLLKRKDVHIFAEPIIDHGKKHIHFDIRTTGVPQKQTSDRTGARCLFCGTFIKKPTLREIFKKAWC